MPKLEVLDLRNNRIGNIGFQELLNSTKFPKLVDFRLDINKIDEAGSKFLTHNCCLSQI